MTAKKPAFSLVISQRDANLGTNVPFRTEIDLGCCKLSGVTLTPQKGGLTECSFSVQTNPTLDKRIGELLDHLDAGIQIAIAYAHNPKQAELAVGDKAAAKAAPKPKRVKAGKDAAADQSATH